MKAYPIVLLVALSPACKPGTIHDANSESPVSSSTTDRPVDPFGGDPVGTDPGGDPAAASNETCDGLDNDGDGQVDEGTGGEPCSTSAGDGALECVDGELICVRCMPGDTREEECGCGMSRIDTCGDSGIWLTGECSPCAAPPTPPTCDVPGACVAGDEMLVRCDQPCTGDNCGTDCVGALWRCTSACEWQEISGCAPRNSECTRDVVLTEPCGLCGHQRVVCDGCFWVHEPCMDEGICRAGDTRPLPCPGAECGTEGYGAVIECTDECVWQTPDECEGCTPGITETTELCVDGYEDCGVRITRTGCEETTITMCGGETLTVGQPLAPEVIRDDCSSLECVPGQTGSVDCTTSAGECGGMAAPCTSSCTLGSPVPDPSSGQMPECVAHSWSCAPGTVETETRSCGPGLCGASETITKTCRDDGCGWGSSGSGCPACPAGEPETRSCGNCGTQSRSCTSQCEWGAWSTCEESTTCTPGATQTRSCSWSCGPGEQTWQCNGCEWVPVSSCQPSDPVTCSPGDEEMQPCVPGEPACGTRGRRCTDSCTWIDVCNCAPDCGGC